MEQSSEPLQPVIGEATVGPQLVYGAHNFQPMAMATGAPATIGAVSPVSQPVPSFPVNPMVQPFHHQQQQQQHQQEQLQAFWANQMAEIEQTTDFKNHSLPLARIKKIMKADEDVRMISAEAPVIFAKACEMFILELTLRAWIHTEENKRRTLQKNDIAAAITRTDIFDFLVDIVPRDELKDEGLGVPRAAWPAMGGGATDMPYYYLPVQPGMIMGKPVEQTAPAAMYASQQPQSSAAYMWPQPQLAAQQQQQQQTADNGREG